MYRKIIIVGERNVARSFLGETILRGILVSKGMSNIEVVSRGLVVLFSEPVSLMALNTLKKHNYDIEAFRSTQLTEEDLEDADLVLTMSKEQADSVREQFQARAAQECCMCLGEFTGSDEVIKAQRKDTEEAYEASFKQMERLMTLVAERIEKESNE